MRLTSVCSQRHNKPPPTEFNSARVLSVILSESAQGEGESKDLRLLLFLPFANLTQPRSGVPRVSILRPGIARTPTQLAQLSTPPPCPILSAVSSPKKWESTNPKPPPANPSACCKISP